MAGMASGTAGTSVGADQGRRRQTTLDDASLDLADGDEASGRPRTGWLRRRVRLLAERRGVRCLAAVIATVIVFHLAWIALYAVVAPQRSNLMLAYAVAGTPVKQTWMDLEDISPNLIKAVVMAEDAQFCRHWGVDFSAIREAIERADHRGPRGASTISMQTAKNLFLWNGRSYVRKGLELPLTYAMEAFWSKRRMLEIYLNIVEWGPGVFGAEAAARHHFGRSAAKLSRDQAARLATALPNPRVRSASARGGRWLRGHRARIAKRIGAAETWAACVL